MLKLPQLVHSALAALDGIRIGEDRAIASAPSANSSAHEVDVARNKVLAVRLARAKLHLRNALPGTWLALRESFDDEDGGNNGPKE